MNNEDTMHPPQNSIRERNQHARVSRADFFKVATVSAIGMAGALMYMKQPTLAASAASMSLTPNFIPVTGDYDPTRLGTTIRYGDFVALANPFGNYLLLSGGSSVRTSVTRVDIDEIWQIVKASGGIGRGAVLYSDDIALRLPKHGGILLSGGPGGMRSNTTVIQTDETWQTQPIDYNRGGQSIQYGEFVALSMPAYNGLLLSGGPGGIRTSVTALYTDEIWQFLKVPH